MKGMGMKRYTSGAEMGSKMMGGIPAVSPRRAFRKGKGRKAKKLTGQRMGMGGM